MKIVGRSIAALISMLALWCVGCGDVQLQTRGTTLGAAVGGTDHSIARATRPQASITTVRARGARRDRVFGGASPAASVRRGVSVWLPYWNMPAALESAVAGAGLVGTASPFWYALAGDSTITGNPGAGEQWVIDALRRRHIRVLPTVTESANMREFDRALASASRRAAMVRALLAVARSHSYSGLDLDFEVFALDPRHDPAPADEAAARYAAFVGEVCGALHAIGRICTVTVMPRTGSEHSYWRGRLATWVYDYGALARVADRVRVMAYDEHAPGGAPGAVAPYTWVQQVVAYAGSVMPAGKVELALPAYGYDWSGTDATSITSRQAPQLALEHRAAPRWSDGQAEETFHYTADGHRHTVWYEDARAEYDRALLAKAAGFAGIDLWAAGGEEPSVWRALRTIYAH